MKKYISLLLVLMLCLSLCACGNSQEKQEKEITAILTQGYWSSDLNRTHKFSDSWVQISKDYTLTFFDDGSYRGEYSTTNIGHTNETEYRSYTGTWSIDGTTITLYGTFSDTILTYTEDHVLHGPKAEGYAYVQIP